jgi:hypothetical protein
MIGGDLNLRNGYTTLRLMWWAANLSTVVLLCEVPPASCCPRASTSFEAARQLNAAGLPPAFTGLIATQHPGIPRSRLARA